MNPNSQMLCGDAGCCEAQRDTTQRLARSPGERWTHRDHLDDVIAAQNAEMAERLLAKGDHVRPEQLLDGVQLWDDVLLVGELGRHLDRAAVGPNPVRQRVADDAL